MGCGLTEGIAKACASSYKAVAVAIKIPMPNEQINLFIFLTCLFFYYTLYTRRAFTNLSTPLRI